MQDTRMFDGARRQIAMEVDASRRWHGDLNPFSRICGVFSAVCTPHSLKTIHSNMRQGYHHRVVGCQQLSCDFVRESGNLGAAAAIQEASVAKLEPGDKTLDSKDQSASLGQIATAYNGADRLLHLFGEDAVVFQLRSMRDASQPCTVSVKSKAGDVWLCGCREGFQQGRPCEHAFAVILHLGPEDKEAPLMDESVIHWRHWMEHKPIKLDQGYFLYSKLTAPLLQGGMPWGVEGGCGDNPDAMGEGHQADHGQPNYDLEAAVRVYNQTVLQMAQADAKKSMQKSFDRPAGLDPTRLARVVIAVEQIVEKLHQEKQDPRFMPAEDKGGAHRGGIPSRKIGSLERGGKRRAAEKAEPQRRKAARAQSASQP
ncbi:unnamed protein product [Chrysoparadoxa australica]